MYNNITMLKFGKILPLLSFSLILTSCNTKTSSVFPSSNSSISESVLKYTSCYFYDVDKKTVLYNTIVTSGTNVTYQGKTPTKQSTLEHIYAFSGWDKPLTNVSGSRINFYPEFTEEDKLYSVNFYIDDFLVQSSKTTYNGSITYTGVEPNKPNDDYYDYIFDGWIYKGDKSIEPFFVDLTSITYDIDLEAHFKNVLTHCDVKFLNYDNSLLQSFTKLEAGKDKFATYSGTIPSRKSDKFTYTFKGWNVDPSTTPLINKNITFIAEYAMDAAYYEVKMYKHEKGTVNNEVIKTYYKPYNDNLDNTEISQAGKLTEKASNDEYSYIFKTFDKANEYITQDCEYYPIFTQIKNEYSFNFVDKKDSNWANMRYLDNSLTIKEYPSQIASYKGYLNKPDITPIYLDGYIWEFTGNYFLGDNTSYFDFSLPLEYFKNKYGEFTLRPEFINTYEVDPNCVGILPKVLDNSTNTVGIINGIGTIKGKTDKINYYGKIKNLVIDSEYQYTSVNTCPITHFNYSKGLDNIYTGAFENETFIKKVDLSKAYNLNDKYIANYSNNAFKNCSNLECVILPSHLTRFGAPFMFQNCSSLKSIIIGENFDYFTGRWMFDKANNCDIYTLSTDINKQLSSSRTLPLSTQIDDELINVGGKDNMSIIKYFYSENEPNSVQINALRGSSKWYWHYDDEMNPTIWDRYIF